MSTQDVANRLVELCRNGQLNEAVNELYAENVVSIEPDGVPNSRVEGLGAIHAKAKYWEEITEEVFGSEISDPVVAGNHFSVSWKVDVKQKDTPRMLMEEVCVYEVNNGKITSEQFHYSMPPQ